MCWVKQSKEKESKATDVKTKKKKNVQKRETLPWENTHCDLFKVLKILEKRTLAYITLLGYEMLSNAAKLCIDNSNFKFVPLAEGSRTGEWCASHPAACCGQPQVYPVGQNGLEIQVRLCKAKIFKKNILYWQQKNTILTQQHNWWISTAD